jgi:ribonuclease HII
MTWFDDKYDEWKKAVKKGDTRELSDYLGIPEQYAHEWLPKNRPSHLVGIGLAGKSACAGPIVAVAVLAKFDWDILEEYRYSLLSGKWSPTKFDSFEAWLGNQATIGEVKTSTVMCPASRIDELGIDVACNLVLGAAWDNFHNNNLPCITSYEAPSTKRIVRIEKSDWYIPQVLAAYVFAKITRDQEMDKLESLYPEYEFGITRGIPTEKHLAAIKKHGACPEHRRTFDFDGVWKDARKHKGSSGSSPVAHGGHPQESGDVDDGAGCDHDSDPGICGKYEPAVPALQQVSGGVVKRKRGRPRKILS